jgi:hypothetical protein
MVEVYETEDGELVGVSARNTWFIKFYGITREEYDDTTRVIKELFKGKGYLYLREANRIFTEKINELKNEEIVRENQALKQKLAEKDGARVPKTIGMR